MPLRALVTELYDPTFEVISTPLLLLET